MSVWGNQAKVTVIEVHRNDALLKNENRTIEHISLLITIDYLKVKNLFTGQIYLIERCMTHCKIYRKNENI